MQLNKATFAGGCFWCMVMPFDAYDGVENVISGYCGGHTENPAYADVKAGRTGHLEAVEIIYDEEQISYTELLDIFWRQVDPTDDGGQFGDRGSSYRTAIFYHNEEQQRLAEQSRDLLDKSEKFAKPIVTRILPAAPFYPAEEYHQEYARREAELYAADSAVQQRKEFQQKTWQKE